MAGQGLAEDGVAQRAELGTKTLLLLRAQPFPLPAEGGVERVQNFVRFAERQLPILPKHDPMILHEPVGNRKQCGKRVDNLSILLKTLVKSGCEVFASH